MLGRFRLGAVLGRSCLAGLLVLVGAFVAPSASQAQEPLFWAPATELSLPADATTTPGAQHASLVSISCADSYECAAVGSYSDDHGDTLAIVESRAAVGWGGATAITLPVGADTTPGDEIMSLAGVACPLAGDCVAVGSYTDTHGNGQAMVAGERNGVWGAATTITLPANANMGTAGGDQSAGLAGVTCTVYGDCVAVGGYELSTGAPAAMVVTETSGAWGGAKEVALPANAGTASGLGGSLDAVSCSASDDCVATGSYDDTSSASQAMIVTESNGSWATRATEYTTLPANEAVMPGEQDAVLASVSCLSSGNCEAVGNYSDLNGNEQPMITEETNGSWQPAVEFTALPDNAQSGQQGAWLESLSCGTAGNCVAAGFYRANNGTLDIEPMTVEEVNGVWGLADQFQVPSNATSGQQDAELDSVSCAGMGCSAAGEYFDDNGSFDQQVMVTSASLVPIADQPISQVVFVHGVRANCAQVGTGDTTVHASNYGYKALYDALMAAGMEVYTFCYDHDEAFGDPSSGLVPGQCFSGTSEGQSNLYTGATALTAPAESYPSSGYIGPLAVSQDKNGMGWFSHEPDDGNGPIAYDAAKLDRCLSELVRYDTTQSGYPYPIAVIGNSMGGAVTRGWLQLAKDTGSESLDGVSTVTFIEGAIEGSWLDGLSEGVDSGLVAGGGSLSFPFDMMSDGLDSALRGLTAWQNVNPAEPGVQDLAPGSSYYRSIAADGTPPLLHYYTLSVDITLDFTVDLDLGITLARHDTDFIGDGLMQKGSESPDALPPEGGSEFLPFGAAADQHQYLIKVNVPEGMSLSTSPPYVSFNLSNAYANPYNHFNFGTWMGYENSNGLYDGGLMVQSCAHNAPTISIPAEFQRVLEDPADACSSSSYAQPGELVESRRDALVPDGARAQRPAPARALASSRSVSLPVVFRDRGGRDALALYTARGALTGRFTLALGRHGTFVGSLASRLASKRVIHLHTTVDATELGSADRQGVRLKLDGVLRPADHDAKLTISSRHPKLRVTITSATVSTKAAHSAVNHAISLLSGTSRKGLANLLVPSLHAGVSKRQLTKALSPRSTHIKRIAPHGSGHAIWFADGNPGWLQPVTITSVHGGRRHVDLLLVEENAIWYVLGATS
ncbi:MAG: hypothetical protein ACRDL5_09295 [Solirubrobacteraceae bacterium]